MRSPRSPAGTWSRRPCPWSASDSTAGDLARDAPQGDRAAAGKLEGLEQRRRCRGQGCGGRQIAQGAPGRAPAETGDDAPLDHRGALELDQLLADRPGERLERLRPARRAQARQRADRPTDQRVTAKAAVELADVVVDPEREAHPRERDRAEPARRPPGAEQDGGP